MYGDSGASDSDFKKCIVAGARKINYYIYGAKTAGAAGVNVTGAADPALWRDFT